MTKRAKKPTKARGPVRLSLLASFCTLALMALLYSVYGLRPQDTLTVGESSPRTFTSPVTTEVADPLLTEAERNAAKKQVEPILTSDPTLQRLVVNAVTSAGLPARVEDLLISAYRNPNGVSEEKRDELIGKALLLTPEEREREVRLLLEQRLLATSLPNDLLTKAARDAAAEAVRPVMQVLKAGQVIVREGEVLTTDHLRALEGLGLYSAQADVANRQLRTFLSCLLLGLFLSVPLLFAVRRLKGLSLRQLGFLIGLTLVALVAQRFAFTLNDTFIVTLLAPILVTVIISELAGISWAIWLAVVMALLDPGSPLFTFFTALSGGLSASLFAKTFKTRTSLLFSGLMGGLAAALGYALLLILYGTNITVTMAYDALILVGGGLLSGVLALGLLPLAESVFDFLTEFRLAELSNPSSPLLQRLLLEAPGTYQHSLIISNLVEQAVTNIGGNALLARVGSLYHDAGKLKRPHFFVENQVSGVNPHDSISPHLSFLIITSHVRDGVELLRDYNLPKVLEPFAASHHGTTVLSYFYKRALEDSSKLDELNFRYPGPKPQTKETAVLLLADAVESASRTLTEPSQGSIRALIDRLIELRLQDGQLADSPLTLQELDIIANTFERMLTAILHRRISYPSTEEIQSLKRGGEARANARGEKSQAGEKVKDNKAKGDTRAGDSQRNPAVSPS